MSSWPLFVGDALAILGTAVTTLSVVGMIRIPNLFAKIHAAAKATVVGVTLVLAATFATGEPSVITRALLVGAFLLLTSPLGAHALARLALHESARGKEDRGVSAVGSRQADEGAAPPGGEGR